GVAAAAVPSARPPGRALVGEEALECQLALPSAAAVTDRSARPASGAALRIPELPPDPVLPLPPPVGTGSDPMVIAVGPGGDEGNPLVVDLLRSGGLLVAGPPGSGRTSLLDAFDAHLSAAGVPVLRISPRTAHDAGRHRLRPDDQGGVERWLGAL